MEKQTQQAESDAQRSLDEVLNEQLETRMAEIEEEAGKLARVSVITGQASLADLTREDAYDRASDGHDLLADATERTRVAEARASTAAALFASSPNATNLAAKEVEAQRAANARAKLQSIKAALAPLFNEEQRRLEVDELVKLRSASCLDLDKHADAIVALYTGFAAQLSEHLSSMALAVAGRRKILARLNDLECRHGGAQHPPVELTNVRELLVERLQKRFSWDIAPMNVAESPNRAAARISIDANRAGYPLVEAVVRISPATFKLL